MATLTPAAFQSKWHFVFADNSTRQISESDFREFVTDMKDSFVSVVDNGTITSWKTPCAVATTANITLSGEQTIDGVLTSASRVLVKNQTTTSQNGIYVSAAGAWARATDSDTAAELEGAAVGVTQGTTNANTVWLQTTDSITLGTSAIVWQQIGFGVANQNLQQVLTVGNSAGSLNITNLANPVNPQDAATKYYVDNAGVGTIAITDLPDMVIEDVTTTTYVFVAADHLKIKRFTHASGCTATIPVGLDTGWSATVYRASGAGVLTLASAGTLESTDTTLGSEKTAATIFHRGSNVHVAVGALGSLGLTIGTIDSVTKSANGAVLSGSSLYLQNADATYPGLISATTQTLAGNKTFNGNIGIGGAPTYPLDVFASTAVARVTTTGTGDANFNLRRTGGTAAEWAVYIPTGSTDLRFFYTADKFAFTSAGIFKILTAPATSTTADLLGRNSSTGALERRTDITSGTWTPTLTNVANVAASSVGGTWNYSRIGTIVSFSGELYIDPTSASVTTQVGFSLPIASAFTGAAGELVATMVNHLNAVTSGVALADGTNDRGEIQYTPSANTNQRYFLTGQYRII